MTIPAVFVTGTVGAGKTAVAREIGELLRLVGERHAVIDLDVLGQVIPIDTGLVHRNLAAIWPNFLDHGIDRLVLSRVLFSPEDLDGYRKVLPEADLTVCRLVVPAETLADRVRARETGTARGFLLRFSAELDEGLAGSGVEDFAVDNGSTRSITEVAQEILQRLAWPTP